MSKRLITVIAGLLFATAAAAEAPAVTPLVEADWLARHLGNEDLIVLDIRSKVDGGGQQAYAAGHIPGAVYSSYTDAGWRTTQDGIVAMLPPIADLEQLIGGLGIDNGDAVVVVPAGVSSTDFGSAARVYWTFKVLGHDRVAILNGGHAAWVAAKQPVESVATTPKPAVFSANFRPELLTTQEEAVAAQAKGTTLIDSRPAAFYRGEKKHPSARMAGTIPGAINLQEQTLVEGASSNFVAAGELEQLIADAGIDQDPEQPVVTFCNTGHWASTTWFALSEVAGYKDVSMYDGSMVGWTADASRPVELPKKGLAKLLDRLTN